MIMLAVVTAMRTFGQSYDRLQQTTAQTSQKREVDRFLRQALRDALPESGYFDGAARRLEWVAPIDRVGSAGRITAPETGVSRPKFDAPLRAV